MIIPLLYLYLIHDIEPLSVRPDHCKADDIRIGIDVLDALGNGVHGGTTSEDIVYEEDIFCVFQTCFVYNEELLGIFYPLLETLCAFLCFPSFVGIEEDFSKAIFWKISFQFLFYKSIEVSLPNLIIGDNGDGIDILSPYEFSEILIKNLCREIGHLSLALKLFDTLKFMCFFRFPFIDGFYVLEIETVQNDFLPQIFIIPPEREEFGSGIEESFRISELAGIEEYSSDSPQNRIGLIYLIDTDNLIVKRLELRTDFFLIKYERGCEKAEE